MDIMGMPECLCLAYPPCSKFKELQRKSEMKKMVRTNVILSFCPEIHFNNNHWGHGSLANINWLLLPSHNSDPLSSLPLHIERSQSVKIRGQKVRYWCILCFHHKKSIQLTYKSSLPLIFNFFTSNVFTNQNLETSGNNQLSMGTPHNKTCAEWCSTQQSTGSECISFLLILHKKFISSKIVHILK